MVFKVINILCIIIMHYIYINSFIGLYRKAQTKFDKQKLIYGLIFMICIWLGAGVYNRIFE
jgi:hypothetical protein